MVSTMLQGMVELINEITGPTLVQLNSAIGEGVKRHVLSTVMGAVQSGFLLDEKKLMSHYICVAYRRISVSVT